MTKYQLQNKEQIRQLKEELTQQQQQQQKYNLKSNVSGAWRNAKIL